MVAIPSTSTSSAEVHLDEDEDEVAPIEVNVEPDIIPEDTLSESDEDFDEALIGIRRVTVSWKKLLMLG